MTEMREKQMMMCSLTYYSNSKFPGEEILMTMMVSGVVALKKLELGDACFFVFSFLNAICLIFDQRHLLFVEIKFLTT